MGSIYSFDKEIRCENCEFSEQSKGQNLCSIGENEKNCQKFRYDVFKRKPRRSPQLNKYNSEDFSIN